ncbi:sensor histidine kinase [Salirhabdus salicampi]|uniref:sensor histidine kinase n=1 Tax=Salirhabdus salicampi TaxID=476102 RepID=UPI0020C2CEE7|nr:sensor histidine kinase [Salirhabdus salicampi]MCP8617590.1 sensor histidine kinase [Salirhabdus salicampi]
MDQENDKRALNHIITDMTSVVTNSKDEIFNIGEQSRQELEQLKQELEVVKKDIIDIFEEGDSLEKKVKQYRLRLAEVSQNFDQYTEEQVRQVYQDTHEFQSKLFIMREKEDQLRRRRSELEHRISSISQSLNRSDNLLSKISVILNYLTDDFKDVYETLQSAKEKQAFGLKIIDAQEEERRRLSREIHDGPAQMLANVMLRSDLVERTFDKRGVDEAKNEIRHMKDMVKSALYEVRRIIYDLRPMALDDLGLIPTLKKYLATVEEHYEDTEIRFLSEGFDKRLPTQYETAFFRLVQEAVQNAVKHANASIIEVYMKKGNSQIQIEVKDNGVGFELDNIAQSSFGILGMKERVEMLNGKIDIQTRTNTGTKVIIKVPLTKQ